MRLWAGKALLMQPECRQMESDTCVCRMVFVVTLWLQIIKCSPWGDFARQAPQMKLTYSERETEETERGMKRQRRRRGGWKDREGDEAWEEHKEMKRMGRNKRKRWKKDPKTCRGRVNVFFMGQRATLLFQRVVGFRGQHTQAESCPFFRLNCVYSPVWWFLIRNQLAWS